MTSVSGRRKKKHNSSAARYQEEEGPPVAREILERLGAREELIEEVCDIVGHHHHPREEETLNFKVIYDADLITNVEEKQKESPSDIDKLKKMIEKAFMTKAGRSLAEQVLLNKR
jgi:hemerythrin superfamily protein